MPTASLPIRWTDGIDVLVVAVLVWVALAWLRRSRARLALAGLAILGGVYLAARWLELQLTVWILQGFFAVLVIVLVVVFQEDLRRIFEQIALWGMGRRAAQPPQDTVDTLTRAVTHLARAHIGALLVLPGRAPLDRHFQGGIPLDAKVSEPLLLSLFDPSSPGHDGAVVVAGSRVGSFALHLPLSTDHHQLGGRGTRHAAALGLAERCDALSIVVSEERGSISLALDGRLRTLVGPEALAGEVRSFLQRLAPEASTGRQGLVRRLPEALGAIGLALLLWMVLVPGAGVVEVTHPTPVVVENLPPAYELLEIDPPQVEVTLAGPRRLLYLRDTEALRVRVDATLAELGRRTFALDPAQVEAPEGLAAVAIRPDRVRLSVRRTDSGAGDSETPP